jgi:hypothetical protein
MPTRKVLNRALNLWMIQKLPTLALKDYPCNMRKAYQTKVQISPTQCSMTLVLIFLNMTNNLEWLLGMVMYLEIW